MDGSLIHKVGPLSELVIERVHRCAAFTAESFAKEFAIPQGGAHLGGCLCVMDGEGDVQLDAIVGKVDSEHKARFHENAYSKCKGLLIRKDDPACVSSWFFRDTQAQPPLYGGGIELFNGSFMAFSGFPEAVDEAFCIAIAHKHHLLIEELEARIVRASGNAALATKAKEFVRRARS